MMTNDFGTAAIDNLMAILLRTKIGTAT